MLVILVVATEGHPSSRARWQVSHYEREASTCSERVMQTLGALDPENPMRIAAERGSLGDAIYHPWMGTMRRLGVKEVSVDVRFVWDGEIRNLQIGEMTYLREYMTQATKVQDAATLEQIRRAGLEDELRSFVLKEAQRIAPEYLRKEGYKRAHGIFPFVFLDDECLPQIVPPAEVVDDDVTDLMRAAEKGDFNCVWALLQGGADVNKQDANGMTALMYAAGGGYTGIVRMLIQNGVDLEVTSRGGETALTTAVRLGRHDTVRALLEAGADRKAELSLWYAGLAGDVEVVKLLLAAGASPNMPGPRGHTALFEAARLGHVEVVKTLLEAGADPNLRNVDGITALGQVLWEIKQPTGKPEHQEVISVLRKAGAKI